MTCNLEVPGSTPGDGFRLRDDVTNTDTVEGEIPEWSKGADCKSVGSAFEGSNPSLPIWAAFTAALFVFRSDQMTPFYADGLRFSCARCSSCCRHDPGYVFLSLKDAEQLAKRNGLEYSSFVSAYCRWIPIGGGSEMLSLKERSNYDCVFWGANGCSVYEDRPLQCKTFPFWDSVLADEKSWRATSADCPGMNTGRLYDRDEIECLSALRDSDPVVVRTKC